MKVLLAEDDAVTRYVLEETLAALGYEVTACADGKAAWDAYRDGEFRLVISDWAMPEMDGVELCRRIKRSARRAPCYFILQTSDGEGVRALDAWDADSYLLKPYDSDELKARLQAAERALAREPRP